MGTERTFREAVTVATQDEARAQRRAAVEAAVQTLCMAASGGTHFDATDEAVHEVALFAYRSIVAKYDMLRQIEARALTERGAEIDVRA